MNADMINRLIFETLQTVRMDKDIKITLDENDRITKFVIADCIIVDIEYGTWEANWISSPLGNYLISYPSHIVISVDEGYNSETNAAARNTILYDAHVTVDDISNHDEKLVIRFGEGRTDNYARRKYLISPPNCGIGDWALANIPDELISYRIPNTIIYSNPDVDREGRIKTFYFLNRKVNVYKTANTIYCKSGYIIGDCYKTYHNSGFIFNTNRELYMVKELHNEGDSRKLSLVHVIKIGNLYGIYSLYSGNQSEGENVFEFDRISANNWVCYETYCKKKDQFLNRTYSIALESDIISSIAYHSEGLASDIRYVRSINMEGRNIHIGTAKKVES